MYPVHIRALIPPYRIINTDKYTHMYY